MDKMSSIESCKREIMQKSVYDIIIQGGQSNAEGCGLGPVSATKAYIPSSEILYLNYEKKVQWGDDGPQVEILNREPEIKMAADRVLNGTRYGDFSLTFAKEYLGGRWHLEGRKVLIVRGAVGGTSFIQGHWGTNNSLYLKMLELADYALQLNPENRIIAFLWHQGESDAINGTVPEVYYKQLTDMLQDFRKRYGNIPFIAGDFVQDWKNQNLDSCQPIINEIHRLIQNNASCAFVETDGLQSNNEKMCNGDTIHFCLEALYELGKRYYKAFEKMKK